MAWAGFSFHITFLLSFRANAALYLASPIFSSGDYGGGMPTVAQ
jgi:hypothetical protein